MKKFLVFLMVLTIMMSCAAAVMAAEYVPSVSFEPYPGLVIIDEDDDGNKIIGYVEDAEGNVVSTEYHGCILITPVLDAKKGESYLSKEAEKLLVDTYETLTADDAKLSVLIPELNDIAKEALGEQATADDLVICELFDITAVCDDLIKFLEIEGNTITLRFKMVVPQEAYFNVMTLNDGKWELVEDVKNNLDGTVSIKFSQFCPVLFITGLPVDSVAPAQNVGLYWLIGLCAVILVLSVVVFYLLRSKRK